MLLKTQLFEKKRKLSSEKKFWPVSSPIFECDKPEERVCDYPQPVLTLAFEVNGLILLHLRSWKHKFLKKKGKLSGEKKFLACFFSHSRVWQTSGDNIWGSTR